MTVIYTVISYVIVFTVLLVLYVWKFPRGAKNDVVHINTHMQRKHKRKRKKPKPNLSTKHNTKKSHMNIDTKKTKNVKRKITKTQPNIALKSRNHL
eukprot:816258_1